MLMFNLLLDHVQFALIHGPDIPGSCAVLFFTASDFTFTTRHIHYWALFPLWPRHFILSGAISNCPLLFLSSILDTFWHRGLIFWCYICLPFHTVDWVLLAKNTGVGCHFFLQWTTFYHNSSLWPVHLGWPCMARLMASLSYASPFTTRRLWSMKGKWPTTRCYFQSSCYSTASSITDLSALQYTPHGFPHTYRPPSKVVPLLAPSLFADFLIIESGKTHLFLLFFLSVFTAFIS